MQQKIVIQNLKCGGCANTITKGISQLEGISNVHVDVEKSTINFTYKSQELVQDVRNALLRMGYPESGDSNGVLTKAKSFVSCATGRMQS